MIKDLWDLDLKKKKDDLYRDHSNYLLQSRSYLQLLLYKNIYTTVMAFWGLVLAEVCRSLTLIHYIQWFSPLNQGYEDLYYK